jgi:hypothetical protein
MAAVTAAVAGAVVVAGSVAQADASRKAARAAGKAAQAQKSEAQRQFDILEGRADEALEAAESPQELAALTSALNQQQASNDKQAQLFAALDPAISAASEQALQLLQGQEAKSLDPIRKSRERQRTKLLNRLREQLGPGAETSSAGIQALNQFDTQTGETLFGAQQQSLGQLFGMGQSGAANRGALNQGIGQLANISGGFGNIAARRSGAINAGSGFLAQAGQQQVGAAGADFVKDQLTAQGQAQVASGLVGAGSTVLGAAAMSGGGAAKPTQPTDFTNAAGGRTHGIGRTMMPMEG